METSEKGDTKVEAADGTVRFFLPDWEDRIYPDFDYTSDFQRFSSDNPYEESVYAHEVFSERPYDGVLFSLAVFREKIQLQQNGTGPAVRGYTDIKKYLRVDEAPYELAVFGDCGAYSYVNKDSPPSYAAPERVARLYDWFNFDYGVSPDHVIVDTVKQQDGKGEKKRRLSKEEKENRRQITLQNAEEFLRIVSDGGLNFTPVAAAQGWNPPTYAKSVRYLNELGYDWVAVGGLARRNTTFVRKVLEAIRDEVRPKEAGLKLHLLGVVRDGLVGELENYGVVSVDSASYLRKAWLRSGTNYLTEDGDWYAAIRVPYSFSSGIRSTADELNMTVEEVEELERKALSSLIEYDAGERNLESTLNAVLDYDCLLSRISKRESKYRARYRRTLESRPWEECNCPICEEIGIHTLIFRGLNRNKRRGFHNVKVLHQNLREGSCL